MAAHALTEHLATWEEVRAATEFTGLLAGNGASRAVWGAFAYESLFDIAANVNETHRLTPSDVALFDALETRNFEHVLAGLATARRVTTALGTEVPALAERYTSIQDALVEAVKSTHVQWQMSRDRASKRSVVSCSTIGSFTRRTMT